MAGKKYEPTVSEWWVAVPLKKTMKSGIFTSPPLFFYNLDITSLDTLNQTRYTGF